MPGNRPDTSDLPLVRLSLVAPALQELRRRKIDATPLLEQFGLTLDAVRSPDVFVAAHLVYQFMEQAATTANDPYFGLRVGEKLELASWPPFTEATARASNTSELLLMCAVNASKDASSAALSLETYGERTKFHVRRLAPPDIKPAQVDAFWIGVLVMILMYVARDEWDPDAVIAKVCDANALPANYAGIRVTTADNRGPRIHFPSSWLFLPYRARAATGKHRAAVVTRGQPNDSLVETVRQALRPRIHESKLTTERAAEICGMGSRTLQQRLQQQGSSVSLEISYLRRERAVAELTNTDRAIADIASQVGYSDPALFSRSFKKWTGQSPKQYRKNHS